MSNSLLISSGTLLLAARMAMLEVYETGEQPVARGSSYHVVGDRASIALRESEKHRFRATVAILVALVINILSGGRAASLRSCFSLVCIQF